MGSIPKLSIGLQTGAVANLGAALEEVCKIFHYPTNVLFIEQ